MYVKSSTVPGGRDKTKLTARWRVGVAVAFKNGEEKQKFRSARLDETRARAATTTAVSVVIAFCSTAGNRSEDLNADCTRASNSDG